MILRSQFYFIIIFIRVGFAAFENTGAGAEPLALGNAMVAFRSNPYAIYYNPAHITLAQQPLIGFCYRTFFGLSSPRQMNLLINHRIDRFPFSVSLNQLGDKNYQETQLQLGTSFTFRDKISMGLSLSLYYLNIHDYSSSITCGINLGFYYPLNDQFALGVLISNLNQPKFSTLEEKLPQVYALGFCYCPQEKMTFCFELFRDVKYEQDYRAGVLMQIKPGFSVKLGLEDKSNTYSLGLGLTIGKIRFDFAALLHNILGLSNVTSIQIPL